jgi:hypothetical protein
VVECSENYEASRKERLAPMSRPRLQPCAHGIERRRRDRDRERERERESCAIAG